MKKRLSGLTLARFATLAGALAFASTQALAQNIKIAISTDDSRIPLGKPIRIHVTIENISSQTVVFPAPRSNPYDVGVIVRDSRGVALQPRPELLQPRVGSRFAYFIKPHGVLKEDLNVSKLVTISILGDYTISIHKQTFTTGGAIDSNTLNVSVVAE